MRGLKEVIIFVAGAAFGGGIAYFATKTKYEAISKEEIEEVKAAFDRKYGEKSEEKAVKTARPENEARKIAKIDQNKPDLTSYVSNKERIDYSKILNNQGYADEHAPNSTENGVDESDDEGKGIYIIDPDAVGIGGYEITSLMCYDDGIIADDLDEEYDIDEYFGGINPMEHWGENEKEPDIVYIRDDKLHIDYEISRVIGRSGV